MSRHFRINSEIVCHPKYRDTLKVKYFSGDKLECAHVYSAVALYGGKHIEDVPAAELRPATPEEIAEGINKQY